MLLDGKSIDRRWADAVYRNERTADRDKAVVRRAAETDTSCSQLSKEFHMQSRQVIAICRHAKSIYDRCKAAFGDAWEPRDDFDPLIFNSDSMETFCTALGWIDGYSPARIYDCLKRANYDTVSDIIEAENEDPGHLLKIRNFGSASYV